MDNSYLVLFRGIERLLIVGAGWLSIFLGYRLFHSLPTFHGSQGKIEALKTSVTLSKVGPGVFFALFGAFILWRSIETVLTAAPQATLDKQSGPSPGYAYFGPGIESANAADKNLVQHVRADIAILNCLSKNIPPKVVEALNQGTMEVALHNARFAMLVNAWQPEWGGRSEQEALRAGKISDAGKAALDIYQSENRRCPARAGD